MITKEDHINSSECEPLFGIHKKTEKLSKNLNFRENGKKKNVWHYMQYAAHRK